MGLKLQLIIQVGVALEATALRKIVVLHSTTVNGSLRYELKYQ